MVSFFTAGTRTRTSNRRSPLDSPFRRYTIKLMATAGPSPNAELAKAREVGKSVYED
jgi:hypothetical protein